MIEEQSLHRQLGLTDDEYARIVSILGRDPNRAELAMYAVMWSEHCSYKSSRKHLAGLPTEGAHVILGPGEGAGVIAVGDAAVALRLESHNHPSFVEPVQGAATGIGGIVRDVLSMGARPIALLDPLRFGPLPIEARIDQATSERNRFLVSGVVSGISSYGNCLGIPTVGGEVVFEDCYSGNPLVNVMCIGVAPKDRIALARAHGPGNAVLLLGSSTGRDGIGGVSVLASASFDESAQDKRPSVQVGDPFTEKLLIEACLELMELGLVVGIQDLGGAGLCCATSESAAKAGTGMRIDLEKVPRREPGMEAFEVLTSESQERMLVIARPEDVRAALAVCEKWGLQADVIGAVTDSGHLEVFEDGDLVADVPAASLGDGPLYDRPSVKPAWIDRLQSEKVVIDAAIDADAALAKLMSSPNIAHKRWVWEQYDHQVMLGTVVKPGADAAILRVPGTSERLAVTVDGNGRYCQIDPREGAKHVVAEAYRNLSALGAEPVAITNCLNFGSPEEPGVMWQFIEATKGMGEACEALKTPVTGGNVSFYNQTADAAIYPTPVVGMVGILPESVTPPSMGLNGGDLIVLVGTTGADLGGSEYVRTILGRVAGALGKLDLDREAQIGSFIRSAVRDGLVNSSHDCSEGGIGVALAEAAVTGQVGAELEPSASAGAQDFQTWLFSESASRYLLGISPESLKPLQISADEQKVPIAVIGRAQGDRLFSQDGLDIEVATLSRLYLKGFDTAMDISSITEEALG